jgi:hypothetical protein
MLNLTLSKTRPSGMAPTLSLRSSDKTELRFTHVGLVPAIECYGDYHVVFTKEELATGKVDHNFNLEAFPGSDAPGISVFFKDQNGEIFHTYSAYARGTETTMNTYNYLDYVPKGRDEDGLAFTMSWLRHHDRYADGYLADADRPYWPADAVPAT